MTERNLLFLTTGLLIAAANIKAGEMLNPGFYLHDSSELEVTNAQSGLVCQNKDSEALQVCKPSRKVLITGKQTCQWSEDTDYPCTRFGYQFEYNNAEPDDALECLATFTDNRGRKTDTYQHDLSEGQGFVFFDSFKTFAVVDTQIILSETHECSYQDQALFEVEFIHYYEPQSANPDQIAESDDANLTTENQDKHMTTLPNTCESPHLDENTAEQILNAQVRVISGTEHLPTFSSACIYRSDSAKPRDVGYFYKFMLKGMFDVNNLSAEEIKFNASFAAGGATEAQAIDDLGKKAFVYQSSKRSTVQVITGIDGPNDSAGRPTVVIASYYLNDGNMSHEQRLKILLPNVRTDVKTLGQ